MGEADLFRVEVRIDVSAPYNSATAHGNISVREEFMIPAPTFTEVAPIMGQFHELAQKVKQEQNTAVPRG